MNNNNIMQLNELADLFLENDLAFSPAELNGFLIGHICLKSDMQAQEWLAAACNFVNIDSLPDDIYTVVSQMYDLAQAELLTEDMQFYPYILDDDYAVEEKVIALAQWCQGYVVGVTAYGKKLELNLVADIKEIILDLTKISQMDYGADDDTQEEKELYYMEILEYVRMAVIGVKDEYASSGLVD